MGGVARLEKIKKIGNRHVLWDGNGMNMTSFAVMRREIAIP
jgi:hypothetical protein